MEPEGIRVRHLTGRFEQALGVMFRRDIGREVFVFVYRRAARRLFHTFFCPPLRVLALADDGRVLADVRPGRARFVPLPETRLIVECSPALEIGECDFRMLADFVSFMEWEG